MGLEKLTHQVTIKEVDNYRRIITGIVYEPMVLDTHGEYMLPQDVESMCHQVSDLISKGLIDVRHDNNLIDAVPVENYIAKKGDPMYPEGAWIMSTKINDDNTWKEILAQDLNAYSFEAMVFKVDTVVMVEVDPIKYGLTTKDEDHKHTYILFLDENGNVLGGRTNTVKGHWHDILARSTTLKSKSKSTRIHRHQMDI